MNVLIIKLSSLGDVVHTLPALAALRKGLKGTSVQIDWLVEEAASSLLDGHPMIDDVIVVKRGWLKNLQRNAETARRLSARRYDLVLDFQGLLKSGAWVFLSKGKRRVGFSNARELSHLFYNEKLPAYDPEKHAVDRYLDLAVYAGGSSGEAVFHVPASDTARESVVEALGRGGLPSGAPFLVMVPRARWTSKLWGDERSIGLAKRVVDSTGLYIVLAGGAADRSSLERMRSLIGQRAVNLAGATGLKELAELMRLANLVVTVDSGPMHVAAAVGTKVVVLFGPTAPGRTGPYGPGHVVIRAKEVECSPCFRKECGDLRCMNGITVDSVARAVEKMAGGAGGAASHAAVEENGS